MPKGKQGFQPGNEEWKKVENPGGPPKYKTPEELSLAIEAYFTDCDENTRPYTVTGLAHAIGLDRKALIEYQRRDEGFDEIISEAKARVEVFAEESLYTRPNVAGVIFSLKNNYGWKDKTERELSGNVGLNGILDEIDGSSAGLPEDQE